MGAVAPILTTLATPALGAAAAPLIVGTTGHFIEQMQKRNDLKKEQNAALDTLRRKQELEQKNLVEANALERERIVANAADEEKQRKAALKRAVARQKALFGASGIGNAANGSSSAVLLGLFDESEDELENRTRLDTLKSRALDLGENQSQSLNVLQRTQLKERQKLDKVRYF